MNKVGWWIASAAFLAAIILGWHALAEARIVSPVFLPTPQRVWNALVKGLQNGPLAYYAWQTITHVFWGWFAASCLAIALGALIEIWPTLREFVQPTLEMMRPLPASATIPIFTLALGLNESMVITVIAFGALWPTLLSTVHGLRSVDQQLYEVAATLRLSKFDTVRKIALPSAMPDILAGMRISITISLILTVVSEMLAGVGGLGQWILNAGRVFRADNLFAGIFVLGLLGLISTNLIVALEKYLLRWKPTQMTKGI